jgi:endonuclease III related protein
MDMVIRKEKYRQMTAGCQASGAAAAVAAEGERELFTSICERLAGFYGPRRWWPVTPEEGGPPGYTGGPVTDRQRLEVLLGAILAQNTSWNGASRAVMNLYRAGLMDFEALCRTPAEQLAPLIRPSGYYNQKARKIRTLVDFLHATYGRRWERLFVESAERMRGMLLGLKGIGPETADSMVLYAAGKSTFVIDNYTRRLLCRIGLSGESASYGELKARFEAALPADTGLYAEFHALIVFHCVKRCTKRKPLCEGCPLGEICKRRGVE